MRKDESTRAYWDSYYASRQLGGIPSQFAAFVLSEFADREKFIDFGCGNGRDTFFFAAHGKLVLGVDGSDSAVTACQAAVGPAQADRLSFEKIDFSSQSDCDDFVTRKGQDWTGAVVYARFFIHAIDETEEARFLQLCRTLIEQDGVLCLEFRTNRDEHQEKVTASHYRRFVSPLQFFQTLQDLGMKVDYFCDGFGMAKYRSDDAHVARFVVSMK